MASLIPGYNYDIFISYRQKDNKYDGWVTEFVENLNKELESAFKDEVSVYFDINPHDGLLETHDVDDSLKNKLKCLVFIPVISRTYCDPKSYAWENEFRAFIEMASHDQLGLKVRLANGNVSSRVLPVRIHDLDNSDIRQCESVMGGFLRGVDLIYKSTGINRPLRSRDDNIIKHPDQILYRDQINKVALAVKDIIEGIRASILPIPEVVTQNLAGIDEKGGFTLQDSGVLLDYHGEINSDTIELIIEELRRSRGYPDLDKNTAKKVYAIIVECLGNISRHSLKESGDDSKPDPYLYVSKNEENILIIAGNPVSENNKNELIRRIDEINESDEESLKAIYGKRIDRELKDNETSAGLGLIIIALKSGNSLKYSFSSTNRKYSVFEIQISVTDPEIKKLIIERTSSSPGVILDHKKGIFEISGESRPDDFVGFYGEILKWLDDYIKYLARQKAGKDPVIFNFSFEYFNSSSAKYIIDIFKSLAGMRSGGHNLMVKWHYREDDEDILEAGQEMSRLARLPVDFIEIPE